jgi:hypothetical protein
MKCHKCPINWDCEERELYENGLLDCEVVPPHYIDPDRDDLVYYDEFWKED